MNEIQRAYSSARERIDEIYLQNVGYSGTLPPNAKKEISAVVSEFRSAFRSHKNVSKYDTRLVEFKRGL